MTETHQITERPVRTLHPYPRNARHHSKKQIQQIAASIERFGFTNPVLVSDAGEIIAGHGRVEAAKLLGIMSVPTVALSHLSEAERRAYVLADNKLALNAGWDQEVLALELQGLIDLDFDLELTGFSLAEIDLVLDEAAESACEAEAAGEHEPEDRIPEITEDPVSRRGDLWQLGRHRLLCGDARKAEDYQMLLGDERMDLVFTDPPYNVPIDGHVCGLGRIRHSDFAMGVGEMSDEAREKGEELPELYPHPEDILLDPARMDAHVLGPTSPEELVPHKLQCIYRDAALAISSEGLHKYHEDSPEAGHRRAFGAASSLMDLALPPSMRLSEDDHQRFTMAWASLTKKPFAARLREFRDIILNNPPTPQAIIDTREGARRIVGTVLKGLLDKLQDYAQAQNRKKPSGGYT